MKRRQRTAPLLAGLALISLAQTSRSQVEGIRIGGSLGGFIEGGSSREPVWQYELRHRCRAFREDGKPSEALRALEVAALVHGTMLVGEQVLCHVMLGDFASAKRSLEPKILEENWSQMGYPMEDIGAYVLASLGERYWPAGTTEYTFGPRQWNSEGTPKYVAAAWPEPTTQELLRFYAGLFVVDRYDRGVGDAIAKQLEGIWRDHPLLIERRAWRYEERRMWQHAINEAQDLYRWTENPDQRGKVDSRIADYALRRDRLGG